MFLVPGFFGFVNFGRMVYFSHVRDFLADALAREGLDVEIHRVALPPTSALRVRAAALHRQILELAPPDAPIHLVGHSTGGLDARLLVSPRFDLAGADDVAKRVRSIISIATPHRGTPLAALFASLFGQEALRLLSLATIITLRVGRLPAGILARFGAMIARIAVADRSSPPRALLDQLQAELLGKLEPGQRAIIGTFVDEVHQDQSLMQELSPADMARFEGGTPDREGVRYGCVVSTATPPTLRRHFGFGFNTWAHAEYALYAWLHRRVGPGDGIVPTSSQDHGERIATATADHLDVIGHFHAPKLRPPHIDWLVTGSGFDRAQFEAVYRAVATFIAR